MSVFNSLSKATVVMILVFVFLAIFTGFALANTDLVKPHTGPAEAEGIRIENAYQQALHTIDIETRAKIAAAQSDAEVARINAEKEAALARLEEALRVDRERNNQQLANEAAWDKFWLNMSYASGLMLIAIAGYGLVLLVRRTPLAKPLSPLSASTGEHPLPHEPWDDPAYRELRIAQARYQEAKDRQSDPDRRPEPPARVIRGNGHTPRREPDAPPEN